MHTLCKSRNFFQAHGGVKGLKLSSTVVASKEETHVLLYEGNSILRSQDHIGRFRIS